MDLRPLEAFHTVVEEGSVSAAAARLGLSQPAVTARLRALEVLCGRALFRRRGNRLELTQAGRELRRRTEAAFRVARDALLHVRERGRLDGGLVHLAADGPFEVMSLLALVRRRHPGLRLQLGLGNTRYVREELESGRVDAAVLMVEEERSDWHLHRLAEDRLVLLLPVGHALAALPEVPLARLVEEEVVVREVGSITRALFDKACGHAGVRIAPAWELGSREAVREAVAAGLGVGVGFAAEQPPDPRLVVRPIAGVEMRIGRYLACLKERAQLRLNEELFRAARLLTAAGRP